MSDADVILDDIIEDGRLVTLAEVLEMLQAAQDAREELAYEQKIALEHARRFARVNPEQAAAIVDAITDAFPNLESKYAVRIADLVPQHPEDVMSIFQKSRHDLSEEDIQTIIGIVDQHYVA